MDIFSNEIKFCIHGCFNLFKRVFKSHVRYVIFLMVSVILFYTCQDDGDELSSLGGEAYYPLRTGMVWVDSMTKINIDAPIGLYDTIKWVEKTTVDSISQASGKEKIYCTNYFYDTTLEKWTLDHVYWFERDDVSLIRFEQNLISLDMVFPLKEGTSWNTYAYSVQSDTSIRTVVNEINQPRSIKGEMYDSALVLHHHIDSTLIYKYTNKSYYAKNIGLIYWDQVKIISDDPDFDYTLPIEERIKTATFIKQKRNYNEIY